MALITTGSKLIRDLETYKALGMYVPLEGGLKDGIVVGCGRMDIQPITYLHGV